MLLSKKYLVRQDKGEDNSLGRMIFRFPNPFSIYMHDTNERNVFSQDWRTVSHGKQSNFGLVDKKATKKQFRWKKNPRVSVGVMSARVLEFTLNGQYVAKGRNTRGSQTAMCSEGCIKWQNNIYSEITFVPQELSATFTLQHDLFGEDRSE